jgi:glutamate 5-kinase
VTAQRRIVAKFGTSLLTAGTSRLDLQTMAGLVGQVAALRADGVQVAVVTSGAIAAGRHRLPNVRARRDVPFRQVLAAVGQTALMQAWEELFGWHEITVAQALLTRRDLQDRNGYINARNLLLALLEIGVVPVINENDAVALDEIEGARIGDNDNLSALVANLVDADTLVLLSDIDGLHEADPRETPGAALLSVVERITPEIEAAAGVSGSSHGTGGMVTKVQAARLATSSGVSVIIADGREADVLVRIARGESLGTRFLPAADRIESRKRWMLSGISSRGRLIVDGGAARALVGEGKSLLPAGIRRVEGRFERGEAVQVLDEGEHLVACGISNYDSHDLGRIAGVRSGRIVEVLGYAFGEEAIHRNNLVLLGE